MNRQKLGKAFFIALIFSLGAALVVVDSGWVTLAGVFLMMWGNNI